MVVVSIVTVGRQRCYFCGRVIEDERELVMGMVWRWWTFSWVGGVQDRVAFHRGCWDEYRRRERRQNIAVGLIILLTIVVVPLIVWIWKPWLPR